MACRDWSHVLTMTTRGEVDAFLKGKTVARLNQRQQRSGLRINYQCKHRKRFGCDYQIYVLDTADSDQIHVFESGIHDHSGNSFLPGFRHGLTKQQKEIADSVAKRPFMNKAKDAAKTMLNLGVDIPNEVQLRNYMSYEKAKYKFQNGGDATPIYPIHNNNNNSPILPLPFMNDFPSVSQPNAAQLYDSLPTLVSKKYLSSRMATPGGGMIDQGMTSSPVIDNIENGALTINTNNEQQQQHNMTEFDMENGEEALSPTSLRRSTRVSALRAQEKLKVDDTTHGQNGVNDQNNDNNSSDGEPNKKGRRLARDYPLDPSDPHFAIQLTENGDVVLLSDDSDVSSLHEEDLLMIKKNYEKIVSSEPSPEVVRERQHYIKMLQAELRLEEAKLIMLKKMQISQKPPSRDPPANVRPANLTNGNGNVNVARANTNNTNNININTTNQMNALNMKNMQAGKQQNMIKGNQQQKPMQQMGQKGVAPRPNIAAHQSRPQMPNLMQGGHRTGTPPSMHNKHINRPETQTPQQREAAAKLLMRKQLEKTLLSIPPPKPPTPEMHFVPNPNQPDFVYYLGLDLTVQRVLKDKTEKMKPPQPYVCTQCATDFTPMWKALGLGAGTDAEEPTYKLMCQDCVRANQKRELKVDHTTRLKAAFVKALQQEQEIAKQIQEGKLPLPTAVPQSSSPVVKERHTPSNNINNNSNNNTSNTQQHNHSTPKQQRPTPTGGGSSSGNRNSQNAQQQLFQQQQQAAAAALNGLFTRGMNPQSLASAFPPMGGFNPNMMWANPMMAALATNPRMANPMALLQAAAGGGGGNQQQQNANSLAALAALMGGGGQPNANMMNQDLMRNLTQDFLRQQQQLLQDQTRKQNNRK